MFTPDLYLFTGSFLIFYRLLFRKTLKEDGNLDLHAMFLCFLGDFAWAVVAMFCAVPFFMMFNFAQTETVSPPKEPVVPARLPATFQIK